MKKILESKLFLIISIVMISIITSVIAANTVINSNSVSYTNSKTNETTVEGSLDELFDAVDINERLGDTDISSIGDGTITNAIMTTVKHVIHENINAETKTYKLEQGGVYLLRVTGFGNSSFMPCGYLGWLMYEGAAVRKIDIYNAGGDTFNVSLADDGTLSVYCGWLGEIRLIRI